LGIELEVVEALLIINIMLIVLITLTIYLLRNPPPKVVECEIENNHILCYFIYEEEDDE
jgi:hypothetical protein